MAGVRQTIQRLERRKCLRLLTVRLARPNVSFPNLSARNPTTEEGPIADILRTSNRSKAGAFTCVPGHARDYVVLMNGSYRSIVQQPSDEKQ